MTSPGSCSGKGLKVVPMRLFWLPGQTLSSGMAGASSALFFLSLLAVPAHVSQSIHKVCSAVLTLNHSSCKWTFARSATSSLMVIDGRHELAADLRQQYEDALQRGMRANTRDVQTKMNQASTSRSSWASEAPKSSRGNLGRSRAP